MIPINVTPLATGLTCPRCHSTKIVKNGRYKHRQNYLCKDCKKTLSTHTGTALNGIHKREKFMQYTKCLEEGLTIKQAAKQLNISISTSFAWRHKHLCALKTPKTNTFLQTRTLSIIKTPYSEKGSRKKSNNKLQTDTKSLICRDIQENASIQTFTTSKSLYKLLNQHTFKEASCILKPNTQLKYVSKRCNLNTNVATSVHKSHYELVHRMEYNLRNWLSKFRGVATKYLDRYWNWFINRRDDIYFQWETLTNKVARTKYLKKAIVTPV